MCNDLFSNAKKIQTKFSTEISIFVNIEQKKPKKKDQEWKRFLRKTKIKKYEKKFKNLDKK